jgi:HEAT repeat protein
MNPERLTQLESYLRAGSVDQRKTAIDELAQCPAEVAVPILQQAAKESDFLCRRFAVMGLANHRTERSFQVLTDLLAQEKDDNVLAEIANSLFEFGTQSVPLLQDLFERNRHWLTRQTILSILMEANDDRVLLNVAQQGLEDEAQSVKETAILALGRILSGPVQEEALDLLIDLAAAPNWRDRWRAATALTLSRSPRAKQTLAKLQNDPNHYVVAAALEAGLPPDA